MMNDLTYVTQSEILEEFGVTGEQYENMLGYYVPNLIFMWTCNEWTYDKGIRGDFL